MRLLPIVLFIILSQWAVAQTDSIYNDDATQRLPIGTQRANPKRILPTPASEVAARIDPPSWFVGMEDKQLQLMIHAKDAANAQVFLTYPGVKVLQTTLVENPNYVFVDLLLAPECRPGKFNITLTWPLQKGVKTKRQDQVFAFELFQKANAANQAQGLDASDVSYLIMPDRFSNGDPSNDSKPGMTQTGINRDKMYFRHGGDIKGMANHLDYLQELGITAIWPNPMLENDQPYESYHGYAISDHYLMDPRLGTNADYKAFVTECHRRGIKVIMDVVTNHVGDQHNFILDLPETDWIHQWDSLTKPNYREQAFLSPYASEYDKNVMLNGWFDGHMPDLNQRNPRVAKFILQNALWWIAYSGHDSYRIDTYIYPDQAFMERYVKVIKDEFPNFLCFGESMVYTATEQAALLKGSSVGGITRELESTCDFHLMDAITTAVSQPESWTGGVMKLYLSLSQDFLYADPNRLVTFLDNHDKSRFFSMVYEDTKRQKSGIACLLTLRGIPNIYYGTEILMKNYCDPDGKVREDFPGGWASDSVNKFTAAGRNAAEQDMFAYTAKLAKYRSATSALSSGQTTLFIPVDGLFIYFRYDAAKTVMVAMNTSDKTQTPAMRRFAERTTGFSKGVEIATGQTLNLETLSIPAHTTFVIELQR